MHCVERRSHPEHLNPVSARGGNEQHLVAHALGLAKDEGMGGGPRRLRCGLRWKLFIMGGAGILARLCGVWVSSSTTLAVTNLKVCVSLAPGRCVHLQHATAPSAERIPRRLALVRTGGFTMDDRDALSGRCAAERASSLMAWREGRGDDPRPGPASSVLQGKAALDHREARGRNAPNGCGTARSPFHCIHTAGRGLFFRIFGSGALAS